MWKTSLVDYRSPVTGSELKLLEAVERAGRIDNGVLVDDAGNRFPIIDGIPRFVPEINELDEAQTQGSFGAKWTEPAGAPRRPSATPSANSWPRPSECRIPTISNRSSGPPAAC
jgi:uncharacterized protein YbaR (Trm112 family)